MTTPGAPVASPRPRRRRGPTRLRDVLSPMLAIAVATSAVLAQEWRGRPPVPEDLRAAMAKADAGAPDDLVRLADSGRADAQYYAGVMFLSGRGAVARDPARGCAYEEKASATRADAMHLVGECYRQGLAGQPDTKKAEAAYARATAMGFPKSKCALGEMLLADPQQAARGLGLCKEAAVAGDPDAQMKVGDLYFRGGPVKADHREARKWYEMAANQKQPQAARRLGEMYAQGDGGKRDTKKALELWRTAEAAGDPFAAILVADQLFSDLTGGQKPGPGKYAFRGGIPVSDIEAIEEWYRQARDRDPRPDVKQRAETALKVLASFKSAASQTASPSR